MSAMTDIVERLKYATVRGANETNDKAKFRRNRAISDAADEITRLRTALSEAEQRVPEGWKLVPIVSTGEMEDAARHLMMWLDFDRPTEAALLAHCKRLGKEPPPECRDVDHVPPKATRLFWVFRAMCAAAPAFIPSEPHNAEGRE